MNATRLRRIEAAYNKIEAAKETLQECLDAEQKHYVCLSESQQASDKGGESDCAITTLTDLVLLIDAMDFGTLREG